MPSFNKFNSFGYEVGKGTHNFASHAIKLVLTNTAPAASNTVIADITQIAASGGYVNGGYAVTSAWAALAVGGKLTLTDKTITATGGAVGPFRYAVLYNSTAAAGPLLGYYDYGVSNSLADTEILNIDFDDANGALTVI